MTEGLKTRVACAEAALQRPLRTGEARLLLEKALSMVQEAYAAGYNDGRADEREFNKGGEQN